MVTRAARLATAKATSSLSANTRRAKPPKLPGIKWVRNNAGWDAREMKSNAHIGYLGAREWSRLQREFEGAGLIEALQEWIEQKRKDQACS